MTIKTKILPSIVPAFFVALNLFYFLPYTIYRGNIEEFAFAFVSLLGHLFLPFLILFFVLSFIGLILPESARTRYVSIVFMLGILVWLQGSIIVWDYGTLTGAKIEWVDFAWRGWFDGALWAVLLLVAVIFSRKIYPKVALVSGGLIGLQVLFFIFTAIQGPGLWKGPATKEGSLSRAPEVIFEFSSEQNVIHIILDAFQSSFFQEIIDEDPERYNSALSGFTFFKENTGVFPTTYMSIPSLLSGRTYKNHLPMPEFFKGSLEEGSIINAVYKNGYDVDMAIEAPLFAKGEYTNQYIIHKPYGLTKKKHLQANAAFVFDLAIFRAAPHMLKKKIYNDQSWLTQAPILKDMESLRLRHFSHKAFIYDLIKNAKVTREAPLYKYIHIMTSHKPYVANKNCQYAGKALQDNKENSKTLQRCSLDQIIDLFDRLRSLGIYDNSLIVVNGDHGNHSVGVDMLKVEGRIDESLPVVASAATPLLIVKPPKASGPLRVSSAQTSLTDIPATINAFLKLDDQFDGMPVFEIDEELERERRFYYTGWKGEYWRSDYLPHLTEFVIKGSPSDVASWRLAKVHLDPFKSFTAKRIDLGTKEAEQFLGYGWKGTAKGSDRTAKWTKNRQAILLLSIPKDKPMTMVLNISIVEKLLWPVTVTVKVDGNTIGKGIIREQGRSNTFEFDLAPDRSRPLASVVEFVIDGRQMSDSEKAPRVLFESLELKDAKL